jgi:S-(hydroxymethyl)glutathione dehydrogenase / alcohol dehydrogenase
MSNVGNIPKGTYRAACLIENFKPLKLLQLDFPKELKSKQVLVRNRYTSICGTQLGEIDGKKGPDPYLPHLLGHEAISEVICYANDVEKLEIGQNVILHWMKGVGGEAVSHTVMSDDAPINAGPVTTFSEYSLISENRCTPISTNLDPRRLPHLGCTFTTSLGVLQNDATVTKDDFVIVLGLGSIGMATLEFLRLFEVKCYLGVDQNAKKVAYASTSGHNSIVWNFEGDAPSQLDYILRKFNKRRLVIIETTGSVKVINHAYSWLNRPGMMVLVGVSSFKDKIQINPNQLHFGVEIRGSYGGSSSPSRDIPYLIRLAEAKQFNFEILPIRTFKLNQINDAIQLIREGAIEKMTIELGIS